MTSETFQTWLHNGVFLSTSDFSDRTEINKGLELLCSHWINNYGMELNVRA